MDAQVPRAVCSHLVVKGQRLLGSWPEGRWREEARLESGLASLQRWDLRNLRNVSEPQLPVCQRRIRTEPTSWVAVSVE